MKSIRTIVLLAALCGVGILGGSGGTAGSGSGDGAGAQTASLLIPAKTRLIIAYSRVATA